MIVVDKYIQEKKLNRDDIINILIDQGIIDKDLRVTKKGSLKGFMTSKTVNKRKIKVKNEIALENIIKSHKKKSAFFDMRNKYPATYRTNDGHYVRSRAEAMVDNWLYNSGISHSYEKKLPIEETLYSDFYIPEGNVYIEVWGMEDSPLYNNRKEKKQSIYKKHDIKLIEICDKDLNNLDDILPSKLLYFGVNIT